MSRIGDLGKEMSNLPSLLAGYDEQLDQARLVIPVKGKTLETAQREQCSWFVYFDERRVELKTLVKYMTAHVAKVRGALTRKYNEVPSKALGERLIKNYIDHDIEYLKAYELLLEVEELFEKYESITDAFTKRGFALRDITSARISEVHNTPI